MLTLATKVKLVTFAILGTAVILFTAVSYANLGRFIGLSGYYVVKMNLPDGGGLFPNADVTYRGVSVGRVGSMGLTPGGVVVTLDISNSAPPIPATGLQATVADLSAVGEEYVNLRPQTGRGPYLTAGMVIPQQKTKIPLPITTLLNSVNTFVTSVPRQSFRTLVAELDDAFQGQGPNLQRLLNSSSTLTEAATQDLPQTTRLIGDSQTVLGTQAADTAEIEAFGRNTELLAQQLDTSNDSLERLIFNTPPAALQVSGLIQENDLTLSAVIANLLTTSEVTYTRQSALDEMLSALPAAVAAGSTVINSHGANFGVALTFFNPYPCTAGYGGTVYRNGLDTSPAPPLNTAASCTLPASSGVDVRGSAHSPTAGAPVTAAAQPGTAAIGGDSAQSSRADALPSVSDGMSQLLGLLP